MQFGDRRYSGTYFCLQVYASYGLKQTFYKQKYSNRRSCGINYLDTISMGKLK